jgi:hypothetical protein
MALLFDSDVWKLNRPKEKTIRALIFKKKAFSKIGIDPLERR